MKILGIDPGMAIVGYGLIECSGEDNIELLASGSIQTDKKLDDSKRLLEIYNDLTEIVQTYKPDCASVENLFFFKNDFVFKKFLGIAVSGLLTHRGYRVGPSIIILRGSLP